MKAYIDYVIVKKKRIWDKFFNRLHQLVIEHGNNIDVQVRVNQCSHLLVQSTHHMSILTKHFLICHSDCTQRGTMGASFNQFFGIRGHVVESYYGKKIHRTF